jgi:hypothetical protein
MDYYNHDHSSFIDQLVRCAYETPMRDFFSSLIFISNGVSDDSRYADLITHACAFYGIEDLR